MPETRLVLSVALVTFTLLQSIASGAVVYDANAAFVANELGAESNPFGPFSVGHSSTLGGFTPFTAAQHVNSVFGNTNLQGFLITNGNFLIPSAFVNTNTVNSQSIFGGIITLDPSEIHLHPGGIGSNAAAPPFSNAILRFTAPTSGNYTIDFTWDSSMNSGVTRNLVLHNTTVLFDEVETDVSKTLTHTLNAGDTVDFVNNSPNGIDSDSTGLFAKLTVESTVVPEPTTLAIWSALGGIGLVAGRWRRRRKAA